MYIYKGKKHDNVINANYRITVNSRLLDTPLLRTVAKSPAETTKKCMEITPAITDSPLLRTGAKSPAETTKKCMEITPAITDSRHYGLPLLRNCGHFMWCQTNIFIVLLSLQRTLS